MFKFIVPTTDNQVDEVKNLFNNNGAVINTKKSKTGKYVSVSIVLNVENATTIISYYQKVEKINENEFSQDIEFLQYLKVLLHYWWIISPISLIGAGAMMAYSMTLPKKYRAECRFEIFENQAIQVAERIKDDGLTISLPA